MRRSAGTCVICLVALSGVLGLARMSHADEKLSDKDREFFEKKIRPVLVTHCYECHSAEAVTRGVLIRPLGPTIYLMPPYCTTANELQWAWQVIGEALDVTG